MKKSQQPLSVTHPQIAKEVFDADPTTISYGEGKKIKWKCQQNHIWEEKIYNRTGKKYGCPICSGHKVLEGFNDLETVFPEIAKEAFGWDPKTVTFGSGKKMNWKCPLGHFYQSTVGHRTSSEKPTKCPYCKGQKVLEGFNDLETVFPEIAKEAFGWDPKTVTFGSGKKMNWKCSDDHTWTTSISNRTKKNGNNCPICVNKKIVAGVNDLVTTHPRIAEQAQDWDPKTVTFGSRKKFLWKCPEGHEWTTTVASRRATGCPSCATSGFDPYKSAWIYFMIQPKWEMYQIGITNMLKDRLRKHGKIGWELLEVRGPLDGQTCLEIESSILKFLKSKKVKLGPEEVAGKFDGYTESWTIDSYQVNNLKELIDKAREAGY